MKQILWQCVIHKETVLLSKKKTNIEFDLILFLARLKYLFLKFTVS